MEAIIVRNLNKTFRVYHERYGTLKGLLLSFRRARYEDICSLRNVNLSVEAGQTVAIVGQNGAGKSTLLGILSKVYRPTSGEVIINGRVSALLELGAGFHPDLTGIENIYLNASILGLSRKEVRRRMGDIVEFAELGEWIDAPIRTYSSGMVMRLGFAIAVQVDPDILLIDEVLAVGDEAFQQKCYRKVQEFQKVGKTIVFVSHDMEAIRAVAHRAVWLDRGEVRADNGVEEVLAAYLESCRQSEDETKR